MRGSPSRKSLDKALKAFDKSDSDLHRRASKALRALDRTHRLLWLRFEERAELRMQAVTSRQPGALQPPSLLPSTKGKENSGKEEASPLDIVDATAETLREFERRQPQLQKKIAAVNASVAITANRIDAVFRDWYDALVTTAVNALWDDASVEKALLLLSAASIGIGLAPAAAIPSALAGAAMLLRDVRDKLSKIKSTKAADRKTARIERALVLIDHVEALGSAWLRIIGKGGGSGIA